MTKNTIKGLNHQDIWARLKSRKNVSEQSNIINTDLYNKTMHAHNRKVVFNLYNISVEVPLHSNWES